VEKAFQAKDQRALEGLIGRSVLLEIDASGSPRTGKVLSLEERATSARDCDSLSAATGERAMQIAKEIRERRKKAELVDCTIDFTRSQVRQHFIWPDALFSAEFELVGTLSKASISTRSIRVTPVAIQSVILQL
jgi:dihydrodipicolinate reductase